MEVYQDKNRDAWVYASETLQLSVTPVTRAVNPDKIEAPRWIQGLRPPGDARKWSAESYRDPNTEQVVTVTSRGAIAVGPAK